ncbi:MAG: serine/threonine-protein kinase [Myxococcota bacterium]
MPARPTTAVSTLGRYAILGRIASGGMATVYLARMTNAPGGFSREFALKVIHPHLVDEDGFCERLLQEARLASRVRHPNVVRTVDAGEDKGYAFMSLELIDGVNLRQLALHRARPFAAAHAAAIVAMVARGLAAVHEATDAQDKPLGMVHRDISPHNVMLDRTGRAVLIDLGLARPNRKTGLTQVGVLAGKLPYMSPEQARVETLDARSDIFTMGTLLFELTTGCLPFGDTHSAATMTALADCDHGALKQRMHDAAVPDWVIGIVLACLRAKPEDRIQSAAELADALRQELAVAGQDEAAVKASIASLVEDAYDTLGVVEQAEPLPRIATAVHAPTDVPIANDGGPARPLRWAAAGALAVMVLGAGGWALSRGATPTAAVATPPGAAGSMSEDQATPQQEVEPVHAKELPRTPAPAPRPTVDIDVPPPPPDGADDTTPPAKPAPRPKRSRTSSGAPELKPNPYATP